MLSQKVTVICQPGRRNESLGEIKTAFENFPLIGIKNKKSCWIHSLVHYSGYQSHATLSRKTSRENLSFGGRQSSPPPCRFT